MTSRQTTRTRRALAMIAGAGALSGAFVMTPAMVAGAQAPAAVPAAKPVKPTTRTVALAAQPVKSVAASGPQTTIPTKSYTNTPTNKRSAVGAGSDAVVEVAATGDLVGVTWPKGSPAADATVLVRVLTADGWKDWHKVIVDAANVSDGDRIGTEPIWEPGARRVQIRVAQGDRALLRTATLAAVTSPAQPSDAALRPTAVPGAASAAYAPAIITRAQWGADESLRPCPTEYSRTTKAVTVHHTADTNSYSASDSARMIRSIYAYETKTLGWCDLAYNAVVDKYGQKFEGRAGGLNKPVKAAHAYAFNNDTFGVSILGNYDNVQVPWAGFNALASVIAMRLDSFYLDPYAKVSLTSAASGGTTRYPAGTTVSLNRINGHRDTSYTACPGRYLYPRLPELRNLVSSKLTYRNSPVYKKVQATGGTARYGDVSIGESVMWPGTLRTVFTSGRRIYAGPRGAYAIGPGTEYEWLRYGGAPRLGNLVTDETSTSMGTFTKLDSGRYITWDRKSFGSYLINGGILGYWNRTGGAWSSTYGMAAGNITSNAQAWWQPFANGHIYFTRAGAAYGTLGSIDKAYFATGGPNGPLGLPTSDVRWSGGVATQTFANATITMTADGSTTVTRRR